MLIPKVLLFPKKTDTKGFFLGCKGKIKMLGSVKVTCMDKNLECAELARFHNSWLAEDPFKDCREIETAGTLNTKKPDYRLTCSNQPVFPELLPEDNLLK